MIIQIEMDENMIIHDLNVLSDNYINPFNDTVDFFRFSIFIDNASTSSFSIIDLFNSGFTNG